MAYANITFATLKALLNERVGGHSTFWTNFELGLAINEALSVWQLLVGEFSATGYLSAANMSQEVEDLYYPATATSDMTDGSGGTVPIPLSVTRVATVYESAGSLSVYGKLVQGSMAEFDHGYPGWKTGTATTADNWAPFGLNKIVFYPRPNSAVRLEYYSGAQPLDSESDYIQLGNEELNRILDYAVWQLNIKSGTTEAFGTTAPLRDLFQLAAATRNAKLRGSQLYKDFLGPDRGETQPDRDALPQKGAR